MTLEFVHKTVMPNGQVIMPGEVHILPAEAAMAMLERRVAKRADHVVDEARDDDWAVLRHWAGERPFDPNVYFHSGKTIRNSTKGDKLLLIRKYGGLGDIIISSCVIQSIHDNAPHVDLTFATPAGYHMLFLHHLPWLKLLDYDKIYSSYSNVRAGVISNQITAQYDIVEDISTPCHIWEQTFTYFGGYNGPLKWRSRQEMWTEWIGLYGCASGKSCITLEASEYIMARQKCWKGGTGIRGYAAICPESANDMKSWNGWDKVKKELEKSGFNVSVFHVRGKVRGDTRAGSVREFFAAMAAADVVVTVDSAALHAAGVSGTKCYALFGHNDGATYCKHYPSATAIQRCLTPCILSGADDCRKRKQLGDCYGAGAGDAIIEQMRIDGVIG